MNELNLQGTREKISKAEEAISGCNSIAIEKQFRFAVIDPYTETIFNLSM